VYKAYVVDDEPSVIEGLKLMVPWKQVGFKLCGDACNSQDALRSIQELRPHLVITDIRMPHKSGLELIHEIRNLGIATEFVILTGYSDFSYAQQAMRSQVSHYLLKPIDKEEMIIVLESIREKLDTIFLTEYGFAKEDVEAFQNRRLKRENGNHDVYGEEVGSAWWNPVRDNFEEELMQSLKLMNFQDAKELIEEMFTYFKDKEISRAGVQVMVNSCIYHVLHVAYERNIRINDILIHKRNDGLDLDKLKKQVTGILEIAIDMMLEDRRRNSRSYLYKVKEYIESNFDKEISVASLAEMEFLESGYLGEAFMKQFGCSINEYQHRLRIEKAVELMKNTELKLKDISVLVGYNNYNNFFTHFERITHKKPTEYI
jgi:two-component system response regulator YesN